ncbi:MAG TPA: pitrilysin family protein [Terracidiphilus sp.]|jgi:predicted Zn-dependent peptidase
MRKLAIFVSALTFVVSLPAQKAPLPKDLPPYGPETPLRAPDVKTAKLDNGLTVWLVSEPGFPKVALTLIVKGGDASDPADKAGISDLLARTVNQGTRTRNARQIAQDIQAAGGDLSVNAGKDSIALSTSFLSSKAEKALAVFSDVAQNPSFPADEVSLAKRNEIQSLHQQEANPSFLASRAMAKALYGDHPYHVITPTEAVVNAATPDDLRSLYTARFRPDQALVVAVGDFENDKMLAAIKSHFETWKPAAGAHAEAVPAVSSTPQHAIFIVPRPGSVQTTLNVGFFGPLRSDPDYEAVLVANAVYGGTFGSRLVTNIREDKGYTYSPGAGYTTQSSAATLVTRADVRNAVTGPTLNEIIYELNRMVTTSPTKDELQQAERFLVGIEAIRLQSRGAVAGELANLWLKGLPPEEIGVYGRKVAAITADDVDAAARKYFPAARTTIVAVGQEKVIRDALTPFGIPIQTAP